ncbi:MAG: hypothetical protein ACI9XP_001469 [Lentimonas sp.]|jgi:hypothetical protein
MNTYFTKFLAVALLGATTTNANAQQLGFKLGSSLNHWSDLESSESFSSGDGYSGTSETGAKKIIGVHFGGTFEYSFNDHFALNTGLFFRTGGTKYEMLSKGEYNDGDGTTAFEDSYKLSVKMNQFEIPIVARIGTEINNVGVYGLIGGFINYTFSGKYSYVLDYTMTEQGSEPQRETESGSESFNMDDEFDSPINYGGILGFGAEYKNVLLEFSYNFGLAPTLFEDDSAISTHALNLTLGYKFGK